jgi:hypothetical protein
MQQQLLAGSFFDEDTNQDTHAPEPVPQSQYQSNNIIAILFNVKQKKVLANKLSILHFKLMEYTYLRK